MYNIHPELIIRNYRSRSGKGAGPLLKEQRESKREYYSAVQGKDLEFEAAASAHITA